MMFVFARASMFSSGIFFFRDVFLFSPCIDVFHRGLFSHDEFCCSCIDICLRGRVFRPWCFAPYIYVSLSGLLKNCMFSWHKIPPSWAAPLPSGQGGILILRQWAMDCIFVSKYFLTCILHLSCMTSGGTESILMAMKAYRDRGREVFH